LAEGRKFGREKINGLLSQAGLPLMPTTFEAAVCPDCGGPHNPPRCHNRPIIAVVALAPGETVAPPGARIMIEVTPAEPKPKRRRTTAGISIPADLRRRLNEQRKSAGLTWPEFLSQLVAKDV
jgi:hypothetical protein